MQTIQPVSGEVKIGTQSQSRNLEIHISPITSHFPGSHSELVAHSWISGLAVMTSNLTFHGTTPLLKEKERGSFVIVPRLAEQFKDGSESLFPARF